MQSKQAAEQKADLWNKSDPLDAFTFGAEGFFNLVFDDTISPLVPRLRTALAILHNRTEQVVADCFASDAQRATNYFGAANHFRLRRCCDKFEGKT